MPSRVIPMEDLEQRSIMYWLPPGGQDNGVRATMWVLVAELESRDVPPVLSRLADEQVGAYAAPSRRKPGGNANCRLYVDGMQYNQAMDALMLSLRGNETRDLHDYLSAKRPPRKDPAQLAAAGRPSAARIALHVVQIALTAAFVALMLAAAYQSNVDRFHPGGHHAQYQPGIHQAPFVRVP
jgi:hypothetical protein